LKTEASYDRYESYAPVINIVQCKLGGRAKRTDGGAADRVHRKLANDGSGIASYPVIESSDATEQPSNAACEPGHASIGHGNSRGTVDRSWVDLDEARYAWKHYAAFNHRP
jgi:hypothetical protein